MKNLEPKIYRKRLTIESKYTVVVTESMIKEFLLQLAKSIGMTPLTKPFIFSPNKINHPLHHGIAGFIGWAESGCSIYTWDRLSFLTVEIYTCKKFNNNKAVKFIKNFFKSKEIVFEEVCYND